jgi:hypothetical protein
MGFYMSKMNRVNKDQSLFYNERIIMIIISVIMTTTP